MVTLSETNYFPMVFLKARWEFDRDSGRKPFLATESAAIEGAFKADKSPLKMSVNGEALTISTQDMAVTTPTGKKSSLYRRPLGKWKMYFIYGTTTLIEYCVI